MRWQARAVIDGVPTVLVEGTRADDVVDLARIDLRRLNLYHCELLRSPDGVNWEHDRTLRRYRADDARRGRAPQPR